MSSSESVVDFVFFFDVEAVRSFFFWVSDNVGDDAECFVSVIFLFSLATLGDWIFFVVVGNDFFSLLIFDDDDEVVILSSSDDSESDELDERILDVFTFLIIIVLRRGGIDWILVDDDDDCLESIDCVLCD